MAQEPTLAELVAQNHREQMFAQSAAAAANLRLQSAQLAQGEAQIAQTAAIAREAAAQRQIAEESLAVQQQARDNAARAAFALWRQTPHGQQYDEWRQRAQALISLITHRDSAWAEGVKQDWGHAVSSIDLNELRQLSRRFRPTPDGLVWRHTPSAPAPRNKRGSTLTIAGRCVAGASALYSIVGWLCWFLLWTQWTPAQFMYQTANWALIGFAVGLVVLVIGKLTPPTHSEQAHADEEKRQFLKVKEQELAEATENWSRISDVLERNGATIDSDGRAAMPTHWTSVDTATVVAELEEFIEAAIIEHPTPDTLPTLALPTLNEIPAGMRSCSSLITRWGTGEASPDEEPPASHPETREPR
ncbi:hypothetical protein PTQ19_11990 [Microbacterium esteraromaticum]|uniref:hypothetical protein n=1 Tax=Microbacterium esteraromaticum TaxID=57043 RepID=UPI002368C348|nr:hypothetical protein [Microbacterium esteraromaticum]WDH78231.1 hypothetical protein PTQ19_11990 [Microbacterium esteraromaticum]